MIRSKIKEKYPSVATSLVVLIVASLAIVAAVIPVVRAEEDIALPDGGLVYPYPDNYDIQIGEDEHLLFAGNWKPPLGSYSAEGALFLVESEIPVILNRITSGRASRLSWGVPGGVSVVVKKHCGSSNDTSILEESDDDSIEVIPWVSTLMVGVNGQIVPQIRIGTNFADEEEIGGLPLAESRMAEKNNDISPNFSPSSEFSLEYKCFAQFGDPCEPTVATAETSDTATPTNDRPAEGSSTAAPTNDRPADGSSSETYDASSADGSSSETYDASSDSSINGVAEDTSASSAASTPRTIATNLLLGLVTTLSILGTAGSIAFAGGRRMICAVTAVFIFATFLMAILPPSTHSLPSFGNDSSNSSSSSTTSTRSLNDNVLSQQHQCAINVEIVYWGCDHQVYIDAPGVSLRNGINDGYSNWDTCQCQAKHIFPWSPEEIPDVPPIDSLELVPQDSPESFNRISQVEITNDVTGTSSMVYHVKGGNDLSFDCMIAIGRPYRDNTGSILSASICDANKNFEEELVETDSSSSMAKKQSPWSKPSLSFLANTVKEDNITTDHHRQRLGGNSKDNRKEFHKMIGEKHRQRIGKEWASRALGEHASIASFAAFTLALMSNGAPPNLIRDSLTAAQDELRHAKMSFEIAASLLSNSDSSNTYVEPTALPPSNLQFGSNLTELALGTAREGCIEETLSAIEMAVEYDEFVADSDRSDDLVTTQLRPTMETIKTIALEEGNHSVLAWRTIEWICSSSKEACKAVQEQVLDPTKLNIAGEKRFPEVPRARQIWKCIWTSLLPEIIGVAGNVTKENENGRNGESLCAFDDNADATLSEKLANRIISQLKPDATESMM